MVELQDVNGMAIKIHASGALWNARLDHPRRRSHLFRNGRKREYIKELRGDSRKEAFDLYNHIDSKELKEAYLAAIPQLGI